MSEPAAAVLAAREVALAQARTLARRGRYAEAERLLDDAWRDADRGAHVLDLLARIHAQQGRLREADRYWEEAGRLAPGDQEIAEGRRRVAAMLAGGPAGGRRPGIAWIGAALLAAAVLALLVDIRLELGGSRPAQAVPGASLSAPVLPPSPSPASPSPASPSRGAAVLDALSPQLRGVRVRRSPGEISVTFERGLFRRGAALSADGRAVLGDLAARLRPYAGQIAVAVIGHTDDRPVVPGGYYASNMELGIMRATVVRELLRTAAGIPTARFSVSALGVAPPAYGDGPPARARNRTVSLRISAADGG